MRTSSRPLTLAQSGLVKDAVDVGRVFVDSLGPESAKGLISGVRDVSRDAHLDFLVTRQIDQP